MRTCVITDENMHTADDCSQHDHEVMDPIVKAKWLEALRSGEYKQTQKTLYSEGAYCCLGVLCDIIEPDAWTTDQYGNTRHNDMLNVPSEDFLLRIGLPEDTDIDVDGMPTGVITHLMNLNDRENKNFNQIADWIEENL